MSPSGVLRLDLGLDAESRAKRESIKQSEAPGSIRVRMFLMFSVFRSKYRAGGAENEAALRCTGASAGGVFSLGSEDSASEAGPSSSETGSN